MAGHGMDLRGIVIGLHMEGKTASEIRQNPLVHNVVSLSTIYRWIKKFEDGGMTMEALKVYNMADQSMDHKALQATVGGHPIPPKPGRPRVTNQEEDEVLVASVRAMPMRPATSVAREVLPDFAGSKYTIYRRLNDAGVQHHRPAEKTELTDLQRANRLIFAHEHVNKPPAYWLDCIWSDEKTFRSDVNGQLHCWRPRGTRYDQEYVVKNQTSGHVTAGFWACITSGGVMALVETTPRMDAPEYCSILEEVLLPHKRAMFGVEARVPFMHDNAPTHTANLTREWMHIHEAEIDLRVHPPYSPDLNPVENLWAKMVNEWDCRKEKTRPALQAHVREVWSNLENDPGCVFNLVRSMPKRMQQIIDSQGQAIKY